jgi:predicted membrane-bound mannosyltransferase
MNTKRIENLARTIFNKSWFCYLILGLITALAAALRFFKLGEWSFWIDEIYTVNHAVLHFSTLDLILDNIPPARNWFPTSVILTAQVLNILGINEWSARLVSATIGILSIPILYFPVKKVFGKPIALVALLLLAVSPWHIFVSNARFYTSLLLFYTLALFAFHFGLNETRCVIFSVLWDVFWLIRTFIRFSSFLLLQYIFFAMILFEKTRMNYRNLLLLGLPILGGVLLRS